MRDIIVQYIFASYTSYFASDIVISNKEYSSIPFGTDMRASIFGGFRDTKWGYVNLIRSTTRDDEEREVKRDVRTCVKQLLIIQLCMLRCDVVPQKEQSFEKIGINFMIIQVV